METLIILDRIGPLRGSKAKRPPCKEEPGKPIADSHINAQLRELTPPLLLPQKKRCFRNNLSNITWRTRRTH